MSHTGILNQELIRQGLEWVKSQHEILIQYYETELAKTFPSISASQRHEVAVLQTEGMIRRLEGQNFDTGELKNIFIDYLAAGVSLERLTAVAEFLQERFCSKVKKDLANKPHVAETLINRANYVSKLLKATMAAAVISYEGQKQSL
jgi:hypothetical protein